MIWFAIRRFSRSSLRHEARPLGGVTNLPSHISEPIPQLVSPSKVLRRPSLLTLFHQLLSFKIGLSTLIWLSKGAEADQLKHLRHHPSCLPPIDLLPIGFTHQLEHLGESPRRIEVISERILERLESSLRPGESAGGGVPRHSPAFVWGPLPRRSQP